VDNIKLFENLSSEKPSPIFLSLAKNNSSGNLNEIKNDAGEVFMCPEDRANYIFDKYQSLFRKEDTEPLPGDAIESFLGPTILNNPIVRNSKLTQEESDTLDQPLTIIELDDAVKKCRNRSAPGADGFSNTFIKKIWNDLRYPLLNYALHCFNSGSLTQNFRSAKIKLIPKKGDPSKLNNWRPISLLSNFYKIISRAINNRLNKIVNRICSRAQKGYNCLYNQSQK
jgi:Reverse transcriptase (RNA-dependent DNA polymerase)